MKHRTINKITSWAFALAAIFAVALALGMAGSAYGLSDNDYENVNGSGGEAGSVDNVTFVHTLKASAAADLSDIVYTVSATPTDLAALYGADRPVGVRDVPSVSGTPISGSFDIALSGASATAPDAGSTAEVKTYTAGKSLADLFGDADAFGQPGVYIFDVAETHAGGSSTDASTWAYGNESYRIRVYVINDPEAVTDTDLVYDGWTVEAISDNGKVSQMDFTSTYSAWRTLDISKAVGGDFGDKTYEFPFEVTVFLPEWYDGTTSLTLDNMTQATAPAQTGGAGPWTGVYQTSLHNGEHASITVPVGTYYKIDEKSAAAASEPGNVVDGVGTEYSVNIDWTVSQASGSSDEPTDPLMSTPVSIYTATDEFVANTTVGELKAASLAIANDSDWEAHADKAHDYATPNTSTVAGLYASYMTGDYSFVFSDDPQATGANCPKDGAGETAAMKYRIIGLNHTAGEGITMMAKNSLNQGYLMNADDGSDGGWAGTDLREALNSETGNSLNACLPPSAIAAAKAVPKTSNGGLFNTVDGSTQENDGYHYSSITQDKFWLISSFELAGGNTGTDAIEDVAVNTQYDLFRIKGVNFDWNEQSGNYSYLAGMHATAAGNSFAVPSDYQDPRDEWWQRSAQACYACTFMCVCDDGWPKDRHDNSAAWINGVVPCFCL